MSTVLAASPSLPWWNRAAVASGGDDHAIDPRLKGHLPALDAVRGLAVVMVTLFRFAAEGPSDSSFVGQVLFRLMGTGSRGVDLFFVLSGFLITGILFDAKGKTHYFRNFYLRRTVRIFPLYYGVLIAASLAYMAWPPLGESEAFQEAKEQQAWLWFYASNVYQAWEGRWALGGFSHFWSLAVEEHFYLFWPLVIYFCSRRQAMAVCGLFMIAAPLLRIALLKLGGEEFAVATETLTPCRMDALVIGALLSLVVRGRDGLRRLAPWILTITITAAMFLLPMFLLGKRLLTLTETLCPLFFAGFIYASVVMPKASLVGRAFQSRMLQFFGKYSYAIYVFQKPLIYLVPIAWHPESLIALTGSVLAGKLAYIALMTLLTTALAIASWHLFEKHFLALKDRWTIKPATA